MSTVAVDVRAVLERMASQAESHRETTSASYPALQRVYEEDRNAVAVVVALMDRQKELEEAAARLAVERAEFRRDRDAVAAALRTVMRMDVKGHQLQDRLQFSDPGRAIINQCNEALARAPEPRHV